MAAPGLLESIAARRRRERLPSRFAHDGVNQSGNDRWMIILLRRDVTVSKPMGNSNESEIRLAELIWRTVKLRVWLLVLAIVALLITWSALVKGNREAEKIDSTFCQYLVVNHNELRQQLTDAVNKSLTNRPDLPKSQPILLSSEEECQTGHSRVWIEITRSTDETLPLEIPIANGIPTNDFIQKSVDEKHRKFAEYDLQRPAAYELQIQLSSEYSGSTIIVNALTIAKVVPFGVFLVLTIVTILGFQQSAYQERLRALLRKRHGDELWEAMAEAQFFAAPVRRVQSRPEAYFALSVDDLAVGTLAIATVVLLFGMVSTFLLNLVHLTDSVISGYPFALYAALILSVSVTVLNRGIYTNLAHANANESDDGPTPKTTRKSKWLTIAAALAACLALALPFVVDADEDYLRGFRFLMRQAPTGRLFNYETYAFSPAIFRDIRILLTIAVAFVVICVLDSLSAWTFLSTIRRLSAFGIFALAFYFVAYLAFLDYESFYWVPWLDRLGLQGPAGAKGYSLLSYNPTYGFWLFFACCLFLVWLSLTTGTSRAAEWTRAPAHAP